VRSVPFDTATTLRSGEWTVIQITVNPAAAKDVRYLHLASLAYSTLTAK
jgi:hypothetical protein